MEKMGTQTREISLLASIRNKDIAHRKLLGFAWQEFLHLPRIWLVVFSLAVVDVAWITLGNWSLIGRERSISALFGCCCLLPLLLVERYRSNKRIRSTLLATFLLIAFSAAACAFSYLAISVGTPLVDGYFARWDHAIGFDWLAATHWVADHPLIQPIFALAYRSGLIQLGFVILFLGFSARFEQLDEFVELYIAGVLLAIGVSMVFPAAGPWRFAPLPMPFDASVLSHFEPLHSGSMRAIDFDHAQGLISMPSVHAMMAIFFCYALRGTGPIYLVALVVNVVMLASTPTEGGHYLVDVVAGCLAAMALILTRRHFRKLN